MTALIDQTLTSQRFSTLVLGLFASVALTLAFVGTRCRYSGRIDCGLTRPRRTSTAAAVLLRSRSYFCEARVLQRQLPYSP